MSASAGVRAAASVAAAAHGSGPRASALVCGHTHAHAALESELAALKETEAALRLLGSQVPKLTLTACTVPLTADSPSFGNWAQWVDAVEEAMRTSPGIAMGPLTRFVYSLTEGTVVAPLVKSASTQLDYI